MKLPALEGTSLARWHSRYASDKLAGFVAMADAFQAKNLTELLGATDRMTDAMVDALLAYDVTGVLGDREWLEANLTEEQLKLILSRILRAHA